LLQSENALWKEVVMEEEVVCLGIGTLGAKSNLVIHNIIDLNVYGVREWWKQQLIFSCIVSV